MDKEKEEKQLEILKKTYNQLTTEPCDGVCPEDISLGVYQGNLWWSCTDCILFMEKYIEFKKEDMDILKGNHCACPCYIFGPTRAFNLLEKEIGEREKSLQIGQSAVSRQIKEMEKIEQFILSGKAVFTIINKETGNRFTYKVNRKEFDDQQVLWFVNLLTGPDNISNYTYMGTIHRGVFKATTKSKHPDSTSFKAFHWFWNKLTMHELDKFPQFAFYHEGRCGRCGRRLTVPESIESGYGPECINKIK
jgi:hypothetical protein